MAEQSRFKTARVGATLKQNIFESYLNRADKVVVVLDQNLRVRILNSFGQGVLKQTASGAIGTLWMGVIEKNDAQRIEQQYTQLWQSGSAETLKNEFRLALEPQKIWSWQHFAVKDRNGIVQAILSVGEDVTTLKFNEQLLQSKEALLKSLSDASTYFLQATPGDWERNVLAVLEQIGKALGSGRVYACKNRQPVTDESIMFLKYEWKHWGETHVFDGFDAHHHAYSGVGLSRVEEALKRREILNLKVSEMDDGEKQWNVAEEAARLLLVPVFVGGEWWGYLGFEDWGEGKDVAQEVLEVLHALSVTFGAAIQRKRIEEELEREKKMIEEKVEERTQELKQTQMELERALVEIKQEKARLTASIHSLSMGFVLVNLSGEVMLFNHAVNDILGSPEGEAGATVPTWTMKRLIEKLKPGVDLAAMVQECVQGIKELKSQEFEYGDKYIRLSLTPIKMIEDDGRVIGAVVLIYDVTEAKRLELTRDEFFAVASHELRTPLTAIRGNAVMIQHYYKDVSEHKDVGKMIKDIADSSGRLIEMVNEYLDVTRAELRKVQLQLEPVVVHDAVKEVMDELQSTVAERNLSWDLISEVPLTTKVVADRVRLLQVITNLLGNAIKYTKAGGISVNMREGKSGSVVIAVTDTGRGIEPGEQENLFQKFKQVGEKVYIKDPAQGTGMGLYISRLLIESMHGQIYLEHSEVGKGSTFAVELPKA